MAGSADTAATNPAKAGEYLKQDNFRLFFHFLFGFAQRGWISAFVQYQLEAFQLQSKPVP